MSFYSFGFLNLRFGVLDCGVNGFTSFYDLEADMSVVLVIVVSFPSY